MNIKQKPFVLFIMLATGLTATAAVHLSEDGKGQAMVIPFYSVANDLNTLVSVRNTHNTAKAIKINIRESKANDAIYSLNLYLDPYDSWLFAMIEDDGFIRILFNDDSCTVNLPTDFNDPMAVQIDDNWNWQTGQLEFIEMGNIDTGSGSAFTGDTLANQCDQINVAWNSPNNDGLWQVDPSVHMLAASGGLTVSSTVIDVVSGFAFDVPPLAFNQFHPEATFMHSQPDSSTPDLSSGTKDSLMIYAGVPIHTTWPTGYEAISALLMKTTVENEYDVEAIVNANSEWVLSFPTLQYHQNNPDTSAPFIVEEGRGFRFPGSISTSYFFYDREREERQVHYGCVITPPDVYCPPVNFLNHAVNTYVVNPFFDEPNPSVISGPASDNVRNLDLDGATQVTSSFSSGKVKLDIKTYSDNPIWVPVYANINDRGTNSFSQEMQIYHGLPVAGFAVQMYRNGNAQPGLLATYASAKAHYGERLITTDQ